MGGTMASRGVNLFLLLAMAIPSFATPITYKSEALFTWDTASLPLKTESFEFAPSYLDPTAFDGVKLSCSGGTTCSSFFGTSTVMPTNKIQDIRVMGSDTVTFKWDTPIYVFAIDVRDLGTNGPTDLIVKVNGKTITIYSNYTGENGNTIFVGVTDADGITSLSITTTNPGDAFYLDRLRTYSPLFDVDTASVPEPATSGLVLGGLVLLGLGHQIQIRRQAD
jgi:hypothetical protein